MALNFHGGYRLEEYKNTKNQPITNLDRAENVFIYLENGEKPCVSVGDGVRRYDRIACNEDGFAVSASVSGNVIEANEKRIVIKNDMRHLSAPPDSDRLLSAHDVDLDTLAAYSKKYGICGAFSGVPVYKKFIASYGKAERVIINCIESDPSSGHVRALIKENAKELVLGIKLIMQGMGIKKCVIAVVKKDGDSIYHIKHQLIDKSCFVFAEVSDKYPAGNEYLLLNSIYKSEFPRDSEPWENGYPLFSAETVINLYKSFCDGLPSVFKVVSVSGRCVETPMNFRVPVGTPISYLFEETGLDGKNPVVYVAGGTLNGHQVSKDMPVLSNTNTVLALKERNYHIGDCIKCARCTMMCPMHLTPFKFHENFDLGKYGENEKIGIFNCIECGICSFVCLGKVDLLGEIRKEKQLSSGKADVYSCFDTAAGADENEDAENAENTESETAPDPGTCGTIAEAAEKSENEDIAEPDDDVPAGDEIENEINEDDTADNDEDTEDKDEGIADESGESAAVPVCETESKEDPDDAVSEETDGAMEEATVPEEENVPASEENNEEKDENNEEAENKTEKKTLAESSHFTEDDGRKANVFHRASEEVTEYRFDIGEDE